MKTLFAALLTFCASSPAFADIVAKDCGPHDYAVITEALKGKIIVGAKLAGEISGLLLEEMGPRCSTLTDDLIRPGIPGEHDLAFELESGSRTYKIFVHSSIENPSSQTVKIIKLNSN